MLSASRKRWEGWEGVCSKSSLPETIKGTFLVSAGPSQIHVVLEVLAQVQVCPAKQIEVETCLCLLGGPIWDTALNDEMGLTQNTEIGEKGQ